MKNLVLFTIVTIMCFFSTAFAKDYYIKELIFNPTSGWCVKTDAPTGDIIMTLKTKDGEYSYKEYAFGNKITKLNGDNVLCSRLFKYSDTWEKIFPVEITYTTPDTNLEKIVPEGVADGLGIKNGTKNLLHYFK